MTPWLDTLLLGAMAVQQWGHVCTMRRADKLIKKQRELIDDQNKLLGEVMAFKLVDIKQKVRHDLNAGRWVRGGQA